MKPARIQVDQASLDEYLKEKRPEGGTYNIWHHRFSGLERDFHKTSVRPKFKVDIERDSGETVGSRNKNAYFCLFFAKGMCTQGYKCALWHRVPTTDDHMETTIDCFGRDKYTEFRQDMGGVGGFIRENRTLYVGRIAVTDDIEDVVRRQFGQFGPLERVRILKNRGVAFVTYKTRSNAEFAREAMMNQCLENNEILNVRWATADPKSTANRLDAEDDLKAQKEAELLETDENKERQEYESELPAEYTSIKRDTDEAGFDKMETNIKKQKAEDEAKEVTEYYDMDSANKLYGYTQSDYDYYYQQQYDHLQQTPTEEPKAGGIIPQNVLSNLKTLTNSRTITPVQTQSGLGQLTGYGSDSDSEEE